MKIIGCRLVCAALTLFIATACSESPDEPSKAQPNRTVGAPADPENGVATHASDVLPCEQVVSEGQWARRDKGPGDRAVNALVVKANGRFGWNGAEIDAIVLGQYLDLVSTMTPSPALIVSFEPGVKESQRREASAMIEESLHCRPEGVF